MAALTHEDDQHESDEELLTQIEELLAQFEGGLTKLQALYQRLNGGGDPKLRAARRKGRAAAEALLARPKRKPKTEG